MMRELNEVWMAQTSLVRWTSSKTHFWSFARQLTVVCSCNTCEGACRKEHHQVADYQPARCLPVCTLYNYLATDVFRIASVVAQCLK